MIQQTSKGLNNVEEANPYNSDGFLPLITAPLNSIVDESNYQLFLDNKIQVCLQRGHYDELYVNREIFYAVSLNDFITRFVNDNSELNVLAGSIKVCIDTANGNTPQLHEAIKQAKEIHGDNLIIMAGNVVSVEAFIEIAKTGVDYIRVGIGGDSGCNTTANTGVGQEDLHFLIKECNAIRKNPNVYSIIPKDETNGNSTMNIMRVKIVADNISSYIKQCIYRYEFNDNGYAAINKLLFAGADLIMIDELFNQCLESAGEKRGLLPSDINKWKPADFKFNFNKQMVKSSNNSINWLPVRWTLSEWLNGSDIQNAYPYLIGWVNSIKTAMAYTGKKKL